MLAKDMIKGTVYQMLKPYEGNDVGTEVEFSHWASDKNGKPAAIVSPVGEYDMQSMMMMYPEELGPIGQGIKMVVSLPVFDSAPKIRMLDLVKDQMVHFIHFRDGEFLYRTDNGFEFPITMNEIANQKLTLLPTDKAIYFMRWIRKHLQTIEEERMAALRERSK